MKRTNFLLFIIGVFSLTQIQIVGSIGIAELVCFVIAPFIYISNYAQLKRDGFAMVLNLSILACLSCVASSIYNHSAMPLLFRGFATCYSIFVFIVVFYKLLWNNILGVRWFFVGVCISGIINIFIFQPAVESFRAGLGATSAQLTEALMARELFWESRVGPWLTLATRGWYLQTPIWISGLAAVIMPVFTMMTTASGRSATLAALGGVFMMLLGGKKVSAIRKVQKNILVVALALLCLTIVFKGVYQYLGAEGALNEKAMEKFEKQAQKGTGLIALLVHGRTDFFMGIMAGVRRPIFGYGPWAVDEDGIVPEFLSRYGSEEDVQKYYEALNYTIAKGGTYGLVPAHSHIVGFWVYYGLGATFIWIYVLYLVFRTFKYNLSVLPQMYGYLCLSMPSFIWGVLFSPYTGRVASPLLIVIMIMLDQIRKGRIMLPMSIVMEIRDYERR